MSLKYLWLFCVSARSYLAICKLIMFLHLLTTIIADTDWYGREIRLFLTTSFSAWLRATSTLWCTYNFSNGINTNQTTVPLMIKTTEHFEVMKLIMSLLNTISVDNSLKDHRISDTVKKSKAESIQNL